MPAGWDNDSDNRDDMQYKEENYTTYQFSPSHKPFVQTNLSPAEFNKLLTNSFFFIVNISIRLAGFSLLFIFASDY